MTIINQKTNRLITFIMLLANIWIVTAQTPGSYWEKYINVKDAGFSADKLDQVSEQFNSSQGAALMVVYKGKVLLNHGDISRRYMTHSIRKSFMNALFGIYVDKGVIKLNSTLLSIGIDDINTLTTEEKKASVENLLTARSGIYLPSAYSPRGMEENLPERESHKPGTHWYYNNWDFNALLTIFEQQTGKKFYEEFANLIAKPLEMEDFRQSDIFYRYEDDRSMHPAYLFNMSARDMARFGLLYLNEGKWHDKQIVPKKWIDKSTSAISKDLGDFKGRGGFGYMWWVSNGINGEPMYYTSGSGGHRIMILPKSDLVIVHRTNTFQGKNVSGNEIEQLVKMILIAKTHDAQSSPGTTDLKLKRDLPESVKLDSEILKKYVGAYKHPFLGYFTVRIEEDRVYLDTSIGIFNMFATSKDTFMPEDLEVPIKFLAAPDEEVKHTIKPEFGEDKAIIRAIMYY